VKNSDHHANGPDGSTRGFWALIVTQFQGALSDNIYKWMVIFAVPALGLWDAKDKESFVSLVGALFALPFVLFAMTGGWMADRFSKRSVTIGTKILEIAVMLVAAVGLALHNLPLMLVTVFLMAAQSALFSPSKYGLLPELLPEKRLSWGNGILEMTTFLAIIIGTAVAGFMYAHITPHVGLSGIVLIALAVVGAITSWQIPRLPQADPLRKFQWNPISDLLKYGRVILKDRVLTLALIGNTYFWLLGALLQLNIVIFGQEILKLDETEVGLLQVALALGIGVGSIAAGYLSGGKVEYGLVPLGALGITVTSAIMGLNGFGFFGSCVMLGLLGAAAGFYAVPVNALVQHRPDRSQKGAVLGVSAFLTSVGTLLAAGVYYLATSPLIGMDSRGMFVAASIITLAASVYAIWLVPDSLLRLVVWLFTHSVYRLRIVGRDNIPDKGGALFVCNHVSFVDALLIIGSTDRRIRAIMYKGIYDTWYVKPFAKAMGAIPISSQSRPRELLKALQQASDAIRNGDVVCIFAEGQITRIGQMLPFRRGFERIMKDVDAPIIPVCLDNVWGSIFSYERGRFFGKWPRYIPYPVTVSYGTPMPPTSTPVEVRQAVQELNSDAWHYRHKLMKPLHRMFISAARRHPFRFAMADMRIPKLSFLNALAGSILMARRLRQTWTDQEMVGILLPPSVPGALVNHAALLAGRVPVNLNYTASDTVLASCAEQCRLKTVVTSKAFLDKVKLTVPGQTILLEEIAANPPAIEKATAFLMACFAPAWWIERVVRQPGTRKTTVDDLATVIFSSGSTGNPKGVMLSHFNIISNIEQLSQTFAFRSRDKVLGVLPFFHSFGFTVTLALPVTQGIGVVYHPSPLDAKVIGELVQGYAVTFLMATPTFLNMYLRGVEPEQFGSLQFVVTGAEKLPERLAQAFTDKYGIRPLEGYGATECSPVVSVNTRDYRAAGFRQVGSKRGSIGHPLPGVSVRVVDPDTFTPIPIGQPGMLLVRGPNVMTGYLGQPEKTAEAIRNDWYVTGDIALLDEDGFMQITDRLSRFSKIGGEMVPHIKVEDKLHELAGATEQCFAVTGLPDEKKGERLVVLHTLSDDKLKPVLEKLAASDLPNLWKPKADQFKKVDALPYLGTGKLDLRQIREIAKTLAA
jgi:acyl-[acyl-carrier-protein]-phospholipid O-acyltransferase/long-chain-fatty-acid--[acyl-carrier-protein] ligase